LIRAVVRAHRWKRRLEQGKCRTVSELAEAEGLTRSFLNRLLRLTLLAPDIVEAILDGGQPKALQLEDLTRTLPAPGTSRGSASSGDRWQFRTPRPRNCGSILSVRWTAAKRRR
jgi:hypothetical protein